MILLDTDLLIVANPGSSDNYFMPLSRFKSDLLSGNFAELLFILERDGISYKTRFGLLSNESSFLPTDIIMLERDGISYKLPIFELIWWITPPPSFIGNLTIDGPEVVYIDTVVEDITKSSITRRVRARDEFGRFLADDPTTPENEAWIDQT